MDVSIVAKEQTSGGRTYTPFKTPANNYDLLLVTIPLDLQCILEVYTVHTCVHVYSGIKDTSQIRMYCILNEDTSARP